MKVVYVKCTDGHWLKVKNSSVHAYRLLAQCNIVARKCGKELVTPLNYYYTEETVSNTHKN